jgi:hypothetical protein
MADSFLTSLFERSREHYESGARWTTTVILLLIGFHVLFYSHFIDLNTRLTAAGETLEDNVRAHNTAKKVAEQLKGLFDDADSQLEARLEQTLEELRLDLGRLSSMVDGIRVEGIGLLPPRPDAERDAGIPPDGGGNDLSFSYTGPDPSITPYSARPTELQSRNMALQAPLPIEGRPPVGYIPVRVDLDQALVEAIKAAPDVQALREILRATIEAQIIEPRFQELNDYWQTEILPRIRDRAKHLKGRIDDAKRDLPGQTPRWEGLVKQIDSAMEAAGNLHFRPPGTPFWASVAGKGATLLEVRMSAREALREFGSANSFLETLEAAVKEQRSVEVELEKKLDALEEAFKQQKGKLSAFGSSLEDVPLDLVTTVSYFPLLIGLVLAALWTRQTGRLKELAWAIQEMTKEDRESPLRSWLVARLPGPWTFAGSSGPVSSLAVAGLAAVGWISFAGWQLAQLPGTGPKGVLLQCALAAAAVLWALYYRLRAVRIVLNDLRPQN